jgi:hypothetical protein
MRHVWAGRRGVFSFGLFAHNPSPARSFDLNIGAEFLSKAAAFPLPRPGAGQNSDSIPIDSAPASFKSRYRKCSGDHHVAVPQCCAAGALPINANDFNDFLRAWRKQHPLSEWPMIRSERAGRFLQRRISGALPPLSEVGTFANVDRLSLADNRRGPIAVCPWEGVWRAGWRSCFRRGRCKARSPSAPLTR